MQICLQTLGFFMDFVDILKLVTAVQAVTEYTATITITKPDIKFLVSITTYGSNAFRHDEL